MASADYLYHLSLSLSLRATLVIPLENLRIESTLRKYATSEGFTADYNVCVRHCCPSRKARTEGLAAGLTIQRFFLKKMCRFSLFYTRQMLLCSPHCLGATIGPAHQVPPPISLQWGAVIESHA